MLIFALDTDAYGFIVLSILEKEGKKRLKQNSLNESPQNDLLYSAVYNLLWIYPRFALEMQYLLEAYRRWKEEGCSCKQILDTKMSIVTQ